MERRNSNLNRRRSSTSSFGAHLSSAGILGESLAEVAENHLAVGGRNSLKDARKSRMSSISLGHSQSILGTAGSVPTAAYGSSCPVQQFGCSRDEQQLPESCQQNVYCQGFFGNRTDLLVRSRVKADGAGGGGAMKTGVTVGLTKWEESGWAHVGKPKSMQNLKGNEKAQENFFTALRVHGLQIVKHADEDAERMMVSFRKDEIPGTAGEIQSLVKALKKISHTCIVKFLQACEDAINVYFIYEDCDGAGLLPMTIGPEHTFEVSDTAKVMQQLAAAMKLCGQYGLYHWDWSLWHLMSSSYHQLFPFKIFGVGLAGVMHNGQRSDIPEIARKLTGWFYFLSPEFTELRMAEVPNVYKKLEGGKKEASDVYALGVVAYYLITGYPPHNGVDVAAVMPKILSESPIWDVGFSHVEIEGIQFLERVLDKLSAKRPSLDAVIKNSWIVKKSLEKARSSGNIIKTLRDFANLSNTLKALGHLFVRNLREERFQAIDEQFSALDISGTGDLNFEDVCSLVNDSRKEVRKTFNLIDGNGEGTISSHEFALACVYSSECLTERLLRATFISLDADGGGVLTPQEVFTVLKEIDPNLGAGDVAQFLGDKDVCWDKTFDVEEFLDWFPKVTKKGKSIEKRIEVSVKRQNVSMEVFSNFHSEVLEWAVQFERSAKQLEYFKFDPREAAQLGSSSTGAKILKLVKLCATLTKTMPLLIISHEHEKILMEGKKRGGGKRSSELIQDAGAMALADVLKTQMKKWKDQASYQENRCKILAGERSKARRSVENTGIIDDCANLFKYISRCTCHFVNEQAAELEAAEVAEGRVPPMPLGSRGAGTFQDDKEDDKAAKDIESYKLRRAQELEEEAQLCWDPAKAKEMQRKASLLAASAKRSSTVEGSSPTSAIKSLQEDQNNDHNDQQDANQDTIQEPDENSDSDAATDADQNTDEPFKGG